MQPHAFRSALAAFALLLVAQSIIAQEFVGPEKGSLVIVGGGKW